VNAPLAAAEGTQATSVSTQCNRERPLQAPEPRRHDVSLGQDKYYLDKYIPEDLTAKF